MKRGPRIYQNGSIPVSDKIFGAYQNPICLSDFTFFLGYAWGIDNKGVMNPGQQDYLFNKVQNEIGILICTSFASNN